jgi:hypothetical protein
MRSKPRSHHPIFLRRIQGLPLSLSARARALDLSWYFYLTPSEIPTAATTDDALITKTPIGASPTFLCTVCIGCACENLEDEIFGKAFVSRNPKRMAAP